ncbi:MAG: hypothetical protein HOQ11_09745 [Gemmatimonadaceae bacterium]|nr:hypothetical protein [Gemmatimonadaceae bacterium]NUQ91830.1 hypothetical protein [Gemmatimonadaceae bacterium]NUR20889.1 hypothetical protein [Gemmatimonadaceae bacterium]NUS97672.1 hypothetical protein [Gemmatimonadaceae bacterium]
MSAQPFRDALGALAVDADVEIRDRLAILRPRGAVDARRIAAERGRITALAAEHGFTHVALELGAVAPEGDATLPRD